MYHDDILRYYKDSKVKREIYEYSLNRWVASETASGKRRIFIRYWWKNGPPLSFNSLSSFDKFLYRFKKLSPRTFYASINIYRTLSIREDTTNLDNILFSSPVWDIDGDISHYEYVIKAAKIIIEELQKYGVNESIYLVWSGRGAHIHINEKAFSSSLLKNHHPLDVSYAVVEYIIRNSRRKIRDLFDKVKESEREFKVENKIDIQRVFTSPLSLHRTLNLSAVCFKPDELDDFDISWADPNNFKHNPNWRFFIVGEADALGKEAIKRVGGYLSRMKVEKRQESSIIKTFITKTPIIQGSLGRFQVMALLQAARYYLLKRQLNKAMSFGLNRAIFYAWAKYHKVRQKEKRIVVDKERVEKEYQIESLGDEQAFLSSNGMFMIGGKEQSPEEYKRQIIKKISLALPYEVAWDTALNYLKGFPRSILLSQKEFYEKIYLPVRDTFEKVIQEYISLSNYEKIKKEQENH